MKAQIDENRMREEFLSLTGQDSISFHEKNVAEYLKTKLQELGFEVTEDDAGSYYGSECGNIYGFLKGTTRQEPVLFSAHMDTVAPGEGKTPEIRDDRIVSKGDTVLGADDVCGIVEILEGIRQARQDPNGHGDIEVLFTIAEEVYGKGSRVFDFKRLRSREAYVLDLSGAPGFAARKAPSIISFRAELKGRAAHAGFAPGDGINALQAAAKVIAKIPQGRLTEQTTMNIGTIQAGTANNIIPETCICTGEVRSLDHQEGLQTVETVEHAFDEQSEVMGVKLDFQHEVHVRAYEIPENTEVCRCFQRACHQLGLSGELKETHGGSDNNIFAEYGLQGIVLSSGMYQIHSTQEYTMMKDLKMGAQLVAEIIRQRREEES